jgi:hypothetical protein
MDRAMMTQKQMTLANTTQENPNHRFTNLYSLMHWDYKQNTVSPATITLMESRDAVKAARPVWREG